MKNLLFIFILFCQAGYSQSVSTTRISAPDSVKQICDKLFISQLGGKLFEALLKFDSISGTKSVYEKGEIRLDYIAHYTFSYPGIKAASVPLEMHYSVYSGKGHLQSGRFLRSDATDLPKNIKEKGTTIITRDQARVIAVKTDSLMLHADCRFVLKTDGFYWNFSIWINEPNPQGDAEKVISHHVIVDPYSGKVKASYVQ